MIREYRAWHKLMEVYVEVVEINFEYKTISFEVEEQLHDTYFDDVILEEETGKRDKHGNMIHVGDIVRDEKGNYYVVMFAEELGCYVLNDDVCVDSIDEVSGLNVMFYYPSIDEKIEIVATIHDKKGLCDYE